MSAATRRRKQDRTPEGNDPVDPLDEVDQEREVERLRADAKDQIELFHNVFSRVCEGAMFLCLVLGVASQDLWCWIHVIGSIFLHWSATRIVASEKPESTQEAAEYHKYLPFVAMLVAAGVFFAQYFTRDDPKSMKNKELDDDMHHMALAVANLVTMLGALYLKWDCQSTKKQVAELEKSKYRYKSL